MRTWSASGLRTARARGRAMHVQQVRLPMMASRAQSQSCQHVPLAVVTLTKVDDPLNNPPAL